jgi:DNA-binding FrmR family transcriptional regulator
MDASTLVEGVRRAVRSTSQNSSAKFKKALSELDRIEQRRAQLIALSRAESQVANELLNEYLSRTVSSPVANGDVEQFKKEYRDHLVTSLELSPKIEALRKWIGGLTRQDILAGVDNPGHIAELKSEFPAMKQVLADAICGKAAELKASADQIAKDEQKRLDEVYGVGEYEAEETQVVKRARGNLAYIETLVKRIEVEPVESLYLDCVRYLIR